MRCCEETAMSSHFLIGALFGSALAIFGGREPVRKLVQIYLERRRDR
jgi:hypothetical protein